MDTSTLLRALLRNPAATRLALTAPLRPQTHLQTRTFALAASSHARFLSVPRVLQPSFWGSMVPKPLRSSQSTTTTTTTKSREWNPATPFIILAMLVGSQAIQILWLKQERAHTLRRTETKIGVLREVIERVQRGENVEVEKVLGTGDEGAEREWAEVLKEVREEEVLFQSKKQRKALREAAQEEATQEAETESTPSEGRVKIERIGNAKFY